MSIPRRVIAGRRSPRTSVVADGGLGDAPPRSGEDGLARRSAYPAALIIGSPALSFEDVGSDEPEKAREKASRSEPRPRPASRPRWCPGLALATLRRTFVAAGSGLTRGTGLGACAGALLHVTGFGASLVAGALADRFGRTAVMLGMAGASTVCSLGLGWLLGAAPAMVVAVGLVHGFAALGDSAVYSTAITEVVPPAYRGAALALRSMPGYGAGAVAPLVFGAILDAHGTRTAGGWGWAFVSPGIAGAGAVVSVIALQAIPEAALLRRQPTARTERSDLCAMTSRTFTIRLATLDDSAPIAAIYNEGIADRIATFETEPRSPEQIRAQLAHRGDRYPTVVVEHEGRVVAWAGAGAYRGRPAYAGVAEHSVYVARDARGTGAGRAALDALCRAYAERGFWKIVSRIFPENVASLALHRRCGFREVGTYRRHGKLEGEWRDCVIVEKLLDGTS